MLWYGGALEFLGQYRAIYGFGARLLPFYISSVLLIVCVLFCKFFSSIFYFLTSSELQASGWGGGDGVRDEVWDQETMFSQLAKRSPCHPAWWSADNCSVIPTVNISIEPRSEPAEQMVIKNNIKSIMHLCFSFILYLSFGTEIVGVTKPQTCQILTNNNVLNRFIDLYRLHRFCQVRTSEDKRSYDADKNYCRQCQIYRK